MVHLAPLRCIFKKHPRFVQTLKAGITGFLLAAGGSGSRPLLLSLGFLLSLQDEEPILAAVLGGGLGTWLFWGMPGGILPMASLFMGLLAAVLLNGTELGSRSWFRPALAGLIPGVLGLLFLFQQPSIPSEALAFLALQIASCVLSALAFQQTPYLSPETGGFLVLALCQIPVLRVLDLGLLVGALLVCLHPGSLRWALCCGLAADLSRITPVPVTPALCLSLLPLGGAFAPALWGLLTMYLFDTWDLTVPMSLFSGGMLSLLLPKHTGLDPDLTARLCDSLQNAALPLERLQQLLEPPPWEVHTAALFDQAANQACRGCGGWEQCWKTQAAQTYGLLSAAAPAILARCQVEESDLPEAFRVRCRRLPAFLSATEQALSGLRLRRQYESRLREMQLALQNQYGFLSQYLRDTAELLRQDPDALPRYEVELGIGATGKFGLSASGDRQACFPGPGQRYYVLLCDGMGAGPGAAQEGTQALSLLMELLQAGQRPGAALEALNDFYVLRETGGFSTADLLELHLDTGRGAIYKWGAAPSYIKHRHTVQKIGTAAPPPGVGIGTTHRAEVIRLSLQRGETVVLVSDGLAGEETQAKIADFAGPTPKALAAFLAAGDETQDLDDRTAIAVRLRPLPLS